MIPTYFTGRCPTNPDSPVFYRLSDGIPRFTARAGSLDWRYDTPGRVASWSPAEPGPWQARRLNAMPLPAAAIVEVELVDGVLFIERADQVTWGTISDEPGAEVAQWRELNTGQFTRRWHHSKPRTERSSRKRQPARTARAGLTVHRGPATCDAEGTPRSSHDAWAFGYCSRRVVDAATP